MASVIPGYEYDIFISYRQKDNRYDGWVTEFVDNFKRELEATFKEDISVYFDTNPHDGLLENHDVDASLKDKLKCLIFIPIISRTYCDPKSFAWEHEFVAFVDQASKDRFGLKVKLPNGNVASRVLPVRIHDLDVADIKLCESVLGGVLRGIEFIYKESGIDKPLSHEDDEKKNLNNTKYRIQIIRVAHSIKEIMIGMKTEPDEKVKAKDQVKASIIEVREGERKIDLQHPGKAKKRKLLFMLACTAIIIIASILAYPKIFKISTLEKLRSPGKRVSVAVMPFQNMTNDSSWNVWQNIVQANLINSLSNSEDLKVRPIETINNFVRDKSLKNYTSMTPTIASNISQKLNADVFIYGNIEKTGLLFRINAQLIDTKSGEVFKSFQIERPFTGEKILYFIDSLAIRIKDFLEILKLKDESPIAIVQYASTTNSPEAFRCFISGKKAFEKRDYPTARNFLSQALAIDSNFFYAHTLLAMAYGNVGLIERAREITLRLYNKRNQKPIKQRIYANFLYASYFETPHEEINNLIQLVEADDQVPNYHWLLGNGYLDLYQYDKAIQEYEKTLEIYKKWDSKPWWIYSYTYLGYAYHITGQYRKEKKLYKKAENDFPEDAELLYRQTILALSQKDIDSANEYIKEYSSILKENSKSEADITTSLAEIYSESNILDKAEECFRQVLQSEPQNPLRINNLAYFLIDKDRNLNEGLALVEKALEISPNDYNFLDTKGLALYKQGKYIEALEALQKSWELRRKNDIYNHDSFLHLEAAKKAVAGFK